MRGITNAKLKQSKLSGRMISSIDKFFLIEKNRHTSIETILNSTNPTRVLERGYSMAINAKGKPVTSVVGLKQGDPLTVVLKDGEVETEVKK